MKRKILITMIMIWLFALPVFASEQNDSYQDVMSHIWFCHNPINGEQCGLCRACEVKMLNDMEWLVTEKAQKRFRKRWFLWQHFGKRFADAVCNRVYR